ncbi:MAG: type II toxin-antitoxin system VapC family toxin [Planctomycetes bacterium]|nr:type II toxin-antitoxin system VapC family toxin [Planctomycetota bacterium]
MIVLDTDHISVLQHAESANAAQLQQRLIGHLSPVVTTAVTLEEQSRSWISLIGRQSDVEHQVVWYDRLILMFAFFAEWEVLPFDTDAAMCFKELRKHRVRIAPTDLKIAAIALVNDATLLTANTRDFERVPGLQFESWLSPTTDQ